MLSAMSLLSAGCSTISAGDLVASGPRYEAVDPSQAYVLGIGDEVRVVVYNEVTITNTYVVGLDGNISLPLIGPIHAADMTVDQFQFEALKRYGAGYLKTPSVSVQISRYRPVYILGEVEHPGQFDYVPGMTLRSLVATATGYTPRAKKSVVFIRGEGAVEEQRYEVTPALRILPGDTIRVGERYF